MRLKTLLRFVVIAIIASASPLAAGVLYDCTVEQKSGPRGWVSPRVGIIIDDSGAAQIIDSLTLYFDTGARPARMKKRGDTLRLNWSFTALSDDSSQMIPNFQFSATLDTKSGAFKMRGKPVRFPERVSGVGTCALRDANLSVRQLNQLLKGASN